MLRAVRLLQSVEAGLTLGTRALMDAEVPPKPALSLEEYLGDNGRLADLSVLLGMREQVRRMANTENTMNAIIASPLATNATFGLANPDSKVAVQHMVKSPTAMDMVSVSESTLDTIIGNPTSWEEFYSSDYYETVVLSVVKEFAQIDQATYSTMAELVATTLGAGALATYPKAMRAATHSQLTMEIVTEDSNAMEDIMDNAESLGIVINSSIAMYLIVRSLTSLGQITDEARNLAATTPSAIKIAAASPLWTNIITGSATVEANLRDILVNVNDLDTSLESITDVLTNADALTIIAEHTPSMQAISEVTSSQTTPQTQS